jgi:hypothetical protein
MGAFQFRVVTTGLFLLLVFLSGFIISRSGSPYDTTLLSFHQVMAFAALIFLAISLYRIGRMAAFNAVELMVCVVTGLFFFGAIISGGLIIGEKPIPELAPMFHKLFAFLSAFFAALIFYLLSRRK